MTDGLRVRVLLARYEHGDVVIDVRPSDLRRHVSAEPCAQCGGRGLVDDAGDLVRCEPCCATGLALPIVDRRTKPR